tara:strand:- start:1249 stop:1497 length:249 start_codon:yes stop_codon:yes gene_type:complete
MAISSEKSGEKLRIMKIANRKYFIALQGTGYYIQGRGYWYIWRVNDDEFTTLIGLTRRTSLSACKQWLLEMEARKVIQALST